MVVESTVENSERYSNRGKKIWRHFRRRMGKVIDSSLPPEKAIDDVDLRVEPVEASTLVLGTFVLWRKPSLSLAALKIDARRRLNVWKSAVLHSHCQSSLSSLKVEVNLGPTVFSNRLKKRSSCAANVFSARLNYPPWSNSQSGLAVPYIQHSSDPQPSK